MANRGWVFCSRITTVGLPTTKAVVNRRVAIAEPPQAIMSNAVHCDARSVRMIPHPSTTAGTE